MYKYIHFLLIPQVAIGLLVLHLFDILEHVETEMYALLYVTTYILSVLYIQGLTFIFKRRKKMSEQNRNWTIKTLYKVYFILLQAAILYGIFTYSGSWNKFAFMSLGLIYLIGIPAAYLFVRGMMGIIERIYSL